ncbi:hypothetical protein V3A08_02550 [Tenacibaculum maritimum]|uniref:hypothetical protein n=1 Tax=Tenacibaculum maritimum TaxID=107401 RepID=UPI0012E5B3E8|nr:hypothetical protein [Tenacibaculum maritimum]CAA0176475.1 conserved hypothetical protein [Tenacibaculum maritimum]
MSLPTLTAGWRYEGWIVFSGDLISTGTFSNSISFDDSSKEGYLFPEEDYLEGKMASEKFPTDLRKKTIIILVEPYPDNSTAPFVLKALEEVTSEVTKQHEVQIMKQGTALILSGTVIR